MAEGRIFVERRGKARRCEGIVGQIQKPREGLVGCDHTGHRVSREPSYLASRAYPGPGWGGFLCAVPMATPLPRYGPAGPGWTENAKWGLGVGRKRGRKAGEGCTEGSL